MMKRIIAIALVTMTFITACKREVIPTDQIDLGKEYFPVEVGRFIEYDVDSLVYNNFTHDTDFVHLQFRDEITTSYTDNAGHTS